MPYVQAARAMATGSYSTPVEDALGPGEEKAEQLDSILLAIGGHLVRTPDNAGQRDRDEQGARAALAREIAAGQQLAGTNTVSIRRHGNGFSEDSTQSWDDPRRIVELPPDRADIARRRNADLARSAASIQQLSGSSTTTGSDPRDGYDTFYERRCDGRIAITYARRTPLTETPPIDWGNAPEIEL